MKKIAITISLFGLFVITLPNLVAQTTEAVSKDIDAKTTLAIKTINANKKLSETEKKNYVTRITVAARVAKTKNDADGKASFDNDFSSLEASYTKKTGEPLSKK